MKSCFIQMAIGFVTLFLLSNRAAAQSCSGATWTPLANGNPANATQVMNNFTCVLTFPDFSSVGINKTPAYVLDVNSMSYSYGTMAQFDNQYGNGGGIRLAYYGATELWLGEGSFTSPALGPQDIGMVARGALEFDSGSGHSRPAMYIASSSNIAVGTSTPLALFDLGGNVTGSNSTADAIRFTELSGATDSRNWLVGNGAGPNIGDLSFLVSSSSGGAPGNTPVLELSRSGNVGINTANPAQALEVNGQVRVDTLASASSTSLCITATSNGVLATCSSSIRYKENVRDADFGLKEIEAMRPVLFKWKGRQEEDLGLIAEEVAKINPLFVTSRDGKIEGVKYAQLTAVVVNAIKQLKAANDRQEAEIARLNAKIETLEHKASTSTAAE